MAAGGSPHESRLLVTDLALVNTGTVLEKRSYRERMAGLSTGHEHRLTVE